MASGGHLKDGYDEYASKPNMLTTKDMTTWLTHAGLMKKSGAFSSNSLDICFSKHKTKGKNCLTLEQFDCVLKDTAKDDYDNCVCKLEGCKKADHMKSKTSKTGGVDRMTDSSKYTGAHKERFDESGKGKGADGRTDKADSSGYVGNYKGEGSYAKGKK